MKQVWLFLAEKPHGYFCGIESFSGAVLYSIHFNEINHCGSWCKPMKCRNQWSVKYSSYFDENSQLITKKAFDAIYEIVKAFKGCFILHRKYLAFKGIRMLFWLCEFSLKLNLLCYINIVGTVRGLRRAFYEIPFYSDWAPAMTILRQRAAMEQHKINNNLNKNVN